MTLLTTLGWGFMFFGTCFLVLKRHKTGFTLMGVALACFVADLAVN